MKTRILATILLLSMGLAACTRPASRTPTTPPSTPASIVVTLTPTVTQAGAVTEPTHTATAVSATATVTSAATNTPSQTAPAATATNTPAATAVSGLNERIRFEANTTAYGTNLRAIASGQIDQYTLWAEQDQELWVSLEDLAAGSQVYLSISGVKDGQVLLRSALGQTSFRGRLPASQDYSVAVVNSGGAAQYRLVVTIPAKVRFESGAIGTTVPGAVSAGTAGSVYVLRAFGGQTMSLALNNAGSGLHLEVRGADGKYLLNTSDGLTSWSGKLPSNQEYYVRVVPATIPATSDQAYTLEVQITGAVP